MNTTEKCITVLLVEDSEDDVFFFRLALRKCPSPVNLIAAVDGKEAVDILSDENKCSQIDVAFLDLKLPLLNGFEVLKWLRSQQHLAHLPVYILSGSSEKIDKSKAADLGATGYLEKPITPHVLKTILPEAVAA